MSTKRQQFPRMPWFPRDFRSSTLGWPLAARAVYRELLDAQWDVGSLPADEDALRMIAAAAPKEWAAAWSLVKPKFELGHDGRLRNPRLEEHRSKDLEAAKNRRDKASRAAAARWGGGDIAEQRPAEGDDAPSIPPRNAWSNESPMLGAMLPTCPPTPTPSFEEKDSPLAALMGPQSQAATANAPGEPERAAIIQLDDHRQRRPPRLSRPPTLVRNEFEELVVAAYHEQLPDLPRVRTWTPTRRSKLRDRIRERVAEGKPADSVEYWRKLFAKVAASDFLCGRKANANWRCPGLEWLLKRETFTKLIEGAYDNVQRGTA